MVCLGETDKIAVAFDPPTRGEVFPEAPHDPLLDFGPEFGPGRYTATDTLIQICLGASPVGLKEPVDAVPRD